MRKSICNQFISSSGVVHWRTLLLIGISAGIIVTAFPRVMTFLAIGSSKVKAPFTGDFLIAVGCVAIMIGVAMVWMYMGTNESTRNLFLAALALPALLSGGFNTMDVTLESNEKVVMLDKKVNELGELLLENANIVENSAPAGFMFESVLPDTDKQGFINLNDLVGPKQAFAGDDDKKKTEDPFFSPGIKLNIESEKKKYIVVMGSSSDYGVLDSTLDALRSQGITKLAIVNSAEGFFLIEKNRYTKTDAIKRSLALKKRTDITPSLINLGAK